MCADVTISEAATAAGCTPAELRAWESRYGWPRPSRVDAYSYRMYTPHVVEQIRQVVVRRNAGTPIGALIVAGEPQLPAACPVLPRRRPDLQDLPEPVTAAGLAAQRLLRRAAERGHPASSVRLMADMMEPRIHPDDRAAVRAVVDRVAAAESLEVA